MTMKLFIPMLIALGALAGCSGGTSTNPGTQTSSQKPQPPAGAVVVSAKEHVFVPSTIKLKKGVSVTLFISNDGAEDHDLKSTIPIASLSYAKADNADDEQTENIAKNALDIDFGTGHYAQVTFTPTTAGTFPLQCGEPGHAEHGMVGQFGVEP